MPVANPARRIVLDWGTTTFRAFLVEGASIADRVETGDGIQSVQAGGFEGVLRRAIAPWLGGALPIYAAGMIGSRNGWVEVPYVAAPADAEALARGARRVELADGASITFIPGLTDAGAWPFPEVMRGEETQLMGFGLTTNMSVVLPGTHSKWARIEGGKIAGFHTFLTGEVFAVLSRHSFLAQMAKPPASPDWPAFGRGLAVALDAAHPQGLLARLFSARTGWLAGKIEAEEVPDYLSGLVIGCEFREAQGQGRFEARDEIGIVGGAELVERYRRAAHACGLRARLGPQDAALRGLLAIADRVEELA